MQSEYYFKEGCYIQEWHNSSDDTECSIARVRVEPQQTTKLHALKNTVERYVLLEGSAKVTVADEVRNVGPGDVVVIGANTAQKITNLDATDLIFLAICVPRFLPENYVELE